jgi:hypothetical protein
MIVAVAGTQAAYIYHLNAFPLSVFLLCVLDVICYYAFRLSSVSLYVEDKDIVSSGTIAEALRFIFCRLCF